MNAVILIAVLSVGNSSIFGSSRTLAALADQGQAPKILGYIDRKGRPIMAILAASVLGFIAYAADSSSQGDVLDWMLALSGLSSIFTWGSICLAHIRFRRAWKLQGHTLDELAFRSQPGVLGSWIGFIFNVLILIAQFVSNPLVCFSLVLLCFQECLSSWLLLCIKIKVLIRCSGLVHGPSITQIRDPEAKPKISFWLTWRLLS